MPSQRNETLAWPAVAELKGPMWRSSDSFLSHARTLLVHVSAVRGLVMNAEVGEVSCRSEKNEECIN